MPEQFPTGPTDPIEWAPQRNSKYLVFYKKLLSEHRAEMHFSEATIVEVDGKRPYFVVEEAWKFQRSVAQWARKAGRKVKCKYDKHRMVVTAEIIE